MKRLRNRLLILMAEKGHREGRTISRRTVAEETGIAGTTVNRYASNSTQRVDLDVVETLLDYFDVTHAEFFEYSEVAGGEDSPERKTPLAAVS